MRGVGVHLAPCGSAGMLMFHLCLSGTNIENAIIFSSGDQCASPSFSVTCVTCVGGPSTSIQRTKICVPLGSPSERYTMRLPSGAHRAPDPFAKNRCCDPSAFMIHNAESHLSSS